ncbi:MAG: hypothetical protein IKI29_06500 [Clostridia bacterium]|nr:hypothetical protein [Clostridia bacterium]
MIYTKTNHFLLKVIAVILSALMLETVVPSVTVFAEESYANAGSVMESTDTEIKTEHEPEIIGELCKKRTLNEKYFLMDDGSITVAQYSQPVHFCGQRREYARY